MDQRPSLTRLAVLLACMSATSAHTQLRFNQASGVFVGPDGYVLTARHVLAGCANIMIEDFAGIRALATIAGASELLGAAILSTPLTPQSDGRIAAWLRANHELVLLPVKNEPVFLVGYPKDGTVEIRGGYVQALTDTRHGNSGFTIRLNGALDSPGAPVFDSTGLLLGIRWGSNPASNGASGYAISMEALLPMLRASMPRWTVVSQDQSPYKAKPGASKADQLADAGGAGIRASVKVYCLLDNFPASK